MYRAASVNHMHAFNSLPPLPHYYAAYQLFRPFSPAQPLPSDEPTGRARKPVALLDPCDFVSYSSVVRMLCLAVALLCFAFPSNAAPAPNLVNGIAVIVGDAVITYKDIQLALAEDLELLERRFGNQPEAFNQRAAELERAKLEEMVENQLVLQEFKSAGYVVPESYFQSRIDEDLSLIHI